MKVSLQQLKASFDLILSEVEAEFGPEIELNKDFYWSLSLESTYGVPNDILPEKDCTIGQLSFDLEALSSIANGEFTPVILNLVPLAEILKGIVFYYCNDGSPNKRASH